MSIAAEPDFPLDLNNARGGAAMRAPTSDRPATASWSRKPAG
jgi:hypothetical protein